VKRIFILTACIMIIASTGMTAVFGFGFTDGFAADTTRPGAITSGWTG